MKQKMLSALKTRYSNLGLSDDQFNLVVPMAVLGLDENADEATIAARASESYISDMLKNMQSQSDKIRTLEKKPKGNDGDGNKGGEHEPGGDGKMDEVLALLKEQKEANAAMQARLETLENADKAKVFDAMVARVGKELNIPAALLDLCKAGLSSDMDENAVKDSLGAKKKTLIDSGVKIDEVPAHSNATQTEAEREAARNWVKDHKVED